MSEPIDDLEAGRNADSRFSMKMDRVESLFLKTNLVCAWKFGLYFAEKR